MRIVIISDLHCGSETGLTPLAGNPIQRQLYNRYADCIEHFGGKPDILIVNGDAVDGLQTKGRSEGDRDWMPRQIDSAAMCISMWRAKTTILVSGTAYHTRTASSVDFEELLALQLKAQYHAKLNLTIAGWFTMQARHKIGGSGVPWGVFASGAKASTWARLNSSLEGRQPPMLSVYSHVHRWTYAESVPAGAIMTTPAWSAIGGLYGSLACDGHVDVGAVQLHVGKTKEEGWTWQKRLYPARMVDATVRL